MNPKVIVIGAGMAGLSAASQLFKSGIRDVLVLEASNRYAKVTRFTNTSQFN